MDEDGDTFEEGPIAEQTPAEDVEVESGPNTGTATPVEAEVAPAAATATTAAVGGSATTTAARAVKLVKDMSPEYPPNCWSPSKPNNPKVYPVAFLEKFQAICGKLAFKVSLPRLEKRASGSSGVITKPHTNTSRKGSQSTSSGGVDNIGFLKSQPQRKVIDIPKKVEKLEKGENAWTPTFVEPAPDKDANSEEYVEYSLKKAQGVLNKLTVDKFDKLSDELLQLGEEMQKAGSMEKFIEKVFVKVGWGRGEGKKRLDVW
jgi:hypothetical protein